LLHGGTATNRRRPSSSDATLGLWRGFLAGAGAPDADVDDLVQETFIRAFRSVDRFAAMSVSHLAADDRQQRAEGFRTPRLAAQSAAVG